MIQWNHIRIMFIFSLPLRIFFKSSKNHPELIFCKKGVWDGFWGGNENLWIKNGSFYDIKHEMYAFQASRMEVISRNHEDLWGKVLSQLRSQHLKQYTRERRAREGNKNSHHHLLPFFFHISLVIQNIIGMTLPVFQKDNCPLMSKSGSTAQGWMEYYRPPASKS